MPAFIKSPKDFFAGLMFLAIAAVFAYGVRELPIGTAFRMGPGYFPLVLVLLLAVFGLIILIGGIRVPGGPIGAIPWRGIVLITLPVIFFGATLKGLGLIPALSITVFTTSLASRLWDLKTSIAITVVLVVFSWAVFVRGLGLPLSLYGPWVGGY
jgi:putative tricarboxylic transport membrane protein